MLETMTEAELGVCIHNFVIKGIDEGVLKPKLFNQYLSNTKSIYQAEFTSIDPRFPYTVGLEFHIDPTTNGRVDYMIVQFTHRETGAAYMRDVVCRSNYDAFDFCEVIKRLHTTYVEKELAAMCAYVRSVSGRYDAESDKDVESKETNDEPVKVLNLFNKKPTDVELSDKVVRFETESTPETGIKLKDGYPEHKSSEPDADKDIEKWNYELTMDLIRQHRILEALAKENNNKDIALAADLCKKAIQHRMFSSPGVPTKLKNGRPEPKKTLGDALRSLLSEE